MKNFTEPIYVSAAGSKGEGVFAKRDIKKGEEICEMKGEKIKFYELFKLHEKGRNLVVDPLQVSRDDYINMDRPYVLINHSCDPNTGIREGSLWAISSIKKGEEITYDYSTTWFDGFDCKCGSKLCRHHIGDFSGIPKKIQKKYLKLGIIPEFIKRSVKI